MAEFVGVRQVPTIPCYQKIAFMERRDCKMEGITRRIAGHDMMQDVRRYACIPA